MIFDYNEKKAKELEKRDPLRHAAKIAELRASPRWYVRYWQDGVPHDEPCPPDYQVSKEKAEDYEKIVNGRIASESWVGIPVRSATISMMCDYYLAKKAERYARKEKDGGQASAKTHCKYIKAGRIGRVTFGECAADPDVLGRYVDNLHRTYPEWSQKYIWNHAKILRAVFSMWVKKRLLDCKNPTDAAGRQPTTSPPSRSVSGARRAWRPISRRQDRIGRGGWWRRSGKNRSAKGNRKGRATGL